ncbi:MAG: helix-turn-helix transcriptional regulator [Jatrophihabitans sp.]|uniref:helix-turn-helix transcriptional regulator n=1 Tax=Jatrophihabitans sp. TaxID=1932789 RepID=UPI00390F4333
MSVIAGVYSKARRDELAAFLRNRRERVTPADVGLAPGTRRRTPGLRREEVAQLAGVGVTWYTWLEQGRPINASVQVLDAIARVLRLGPSERWHLYRLAEVPGVPRPSSPVAVAAEVVAVLDALDPSPACVYDGKYDLMASNASYAALFPFLVEASGMQRNALWQTYARKGTPPPVTDPDVCAAMIATLRANYANHVGDPEWTELIDTLCTARNDFARLWAQHPIAEPGPPLTKSFECFGLGTVRVRSTAFLLQRTLDCRMVVYLPDTAADVALIAELRARRERRLRPA